MDLSQEKDLFNGILVTGILGRKSIYFESSDYPKVINFCGIVFFAIWRSEKMQFCEINFFNWSKSYRRKLMVVSLTQETLYL